MELALCASSRRIAYIYEDGKFSFTPTERSRQAAGQAAGADEVARANGAVRPVATAG